MRNILMKVFWPILSYFETDDVPANYKESHRKILIFVGALFILLSTVTTGFAFSTGQLGALIPIIVFFSVGLVSLVVGTLGSNAAVSKIWGTK